MPFQVVSACSSIDKYSRNTLMLVSIQLHENRVETFWSGLQSVLRNIHKNGLTNTVTSKCYAAIHDILPTHDPLAAIHLVPTTACPNCQNQDSVLHRITECSDGYLQSKLTNQNLSRILRIDCKRIPKVWTMYPDIRLWPPQRQAAVLWIIGQFIYYRIQNGSHSSLRDYIDSIHGDKWTVNHTTAVPI